MFQYCNLLRQLENFPANDEQNSTLKDLITQFCTKLQEKKEKKQEIELASDSDKKTLERKLRRFDYNFRKIKSHLHSELDKLVKTLPFVKRDLKIQNQSVHYKQHEYVELIDDVMTQAINLICTDLQLNSDHLLIANILNWIKRIKPLRLEYRWKEITFQAKKNPEVRNLLIIQELTKTCDNGFTLNQFVEQVTHSRKEVTQERVDKLKDYLEKTIEKRKGEKFDLEGETYYKFDIRNIQLSAKQENVIESKRDPNSLDNSKGNNNENDNVQTHLGSLVDENPSHNFWEILESIKKEETTNQINEIINNNFLNEELSPISQQIHQEIRKQASEGKKVILDPIFEDIAEKNHKAKSTIRSEYERKLLPNYYKKIIDNYSPNILNKNPSLSELELSEYKKRDDSLRKYINEDPDNKLKNCYLKKFSNKTQNSEKNSEKNLECNAQSLMQELLFIFPKTQRKNISKLAQIYNIGRDKLERFWKGEVLRILIKIIGDDLSYDPDLYEK